MYNVFFNDRLLSIVDDHTSVNDADLTLRLKGNEKEAFVHSLIAEFEKNIPVQMMVIKSMNIKKTWKTFINKFTLIEAAGGVVFNPENKMLMIFRHNKWDLPKGKLDENESPESAAIREVGEECGLKDLKIVEPLTSTYHTYYLKDKSILKKTYWYKMISLEKELTPQQEEDITEAKWMNRYEVKKACNNSYATIVRLLREHKFINRENI